MTKSEKALVEKIKYSLEYNWRNWDFDGHILHNRKTDLRLWVANGAYGVNVVTESLGAPDLFCWKSRKIIYHAFLEWRRRKAAFDL